MTPIDDELRSLLHTRADVLSPAADPLQGIERRARRMRRTRIAAAVAGTALAVSAVAIAVPALRPGDDGGTTQFAKSPAPTQTALPPAALDPQHPWAYRGDPSVVAGNELVTLRAEWTTKHPGTTLTPLFGQVYEPSGRPEVVFVSTSQGNDRWGVATSSEAGWAFPYDAVLPFGSTVLMAPLAGDEVPRLLVVAAPSTGDISYAADGTSYKSVPMVQPGVAFHALEGDTSKDAVRVLDGDGNLDKPVFVGPAPDYGSATNGGAPGTTTPANLLDWPQVGSVDAAVAAAVTAGFADAMGAKPADVETKVLLAGMDGTGRTVVLAQGWVHGNDARNYLWWGSSDGTGQGQLGKPTDVGPAALVALVPAQGKGVQTLVVVGAPDSAHVGYTSTPTGTFNTVEGGRAVLIDRSVDAGTSDRIQLTDTGGTMLFRSTVRQAVCTTMTCN